MVNNKLLDFFCKCRAADIPLTGPMFQTKTLQIVKTLGNVYIHAMCVYRVHVLRAVCRIPHIAALLLAEIYFFNIKLDAVFRYYVVIPSSEGLKSGKMHNVSRKIIR